MNGREYSEPGANGSAISGMKSLSRNCPTWTGPGFKPTDESKRQNFLVPLELSESSLEGMRHALELAKKEGAEIILLHVIDVNLNWPPTGPANVEQMRQELWAEAEIQMQLYVDSVRRFGVSVRSVIKEGVTAESILSVAKECEASLIIMEKNKAGWKFLGRHTTRRVAEGAPCPMLTVP